MDMTGCKVSIIIPERNEIGHIENCICSILRQTYPREDMEVIFVDGMSEDGTREVIQKFVADNPNLIFLYDNPASIVPVAMNIGIRAARGEVIIRLDAHSEYSNTYVAQCVQTLMETGADNVGGLAVTEGIGDLGKAYAEVLSSKFGVGNSGFRTNAESGYVDTVPFGTYKKESLIQCGMYDERLARNQDYELNDRIRKGGGKIYLNSEIRLTYFCRNTWKGIIQQGFENGKWNVITMKLCPGSMGIRHFIPLAFFLSLIVLPILSWFWEPVGFLFVAEILLYLGLDLTCALRPSAKKILKFALFPVLHISYGLGSFCGIFTPSQKAGKIVV